MLSAEFSISLLCTEQETCAKDTGTDLKPNIWNSTVVVPAKYLSKVNTLVNNDQY